MFVGTRWYPIPSQQLNQQNAMSCATCVFLGSSRSLVSRCKAYSGQIHTVEVTGSNPVAPTIFSKGYTKNCSKSPTQDEVVYLAKDTKTKTLQETRCTPTEFVAMLSPHVLDRYRHSMRYFGLLAPRTKRLTSPAVFELLGQHPRPKPPRQGWADSLKQHFGVDPLVDEFGNPMHWVGRRQPVPVRALPTAGR